MSVKAQKRDTVRRVQFLYIPSLYNQSKTVDEDNDQLPKLD